MFRWKITREAIGHTWHTARLDHSLFEGAGVIHKEPYMTHILLDVPNLEVNDSVLSLIVIPSPSKNIKYPPNGTQNERSNTKPMFLQWYVILRDGLSTRDGPSFAPQVDWWLSHICWISQKGILDTSSSPQREVSWRFRPSKRQSADEENSCWGTQRLDFASCWNAKSGIYSSASKQIAIWNFLNSQWNWIGRIYELTRF